MKLRALDKVLLFVGGFLCAVIGLGVFMVGMQAEPLRISDLVGSSFTVNDLWLLGGGALLFVLGIYLIGLPHSYRRKKDGFIVQQTADGEMRISVHAMDGMVRKLMEPRGEMILKSVDVDHRKDHVFIHLKVSVAKNVNIPLAVAALQRDVKQHLLSATGVDVREVKVTVDTSDELAADSPYLMREQPPAPPREEE